jgi:hypothetical protein
MSHLFIYTGLLLFLTTSQQIRDSKTDKRTISVSSIQAAEGDNFILNYLKKNIRYPLAAVKNNQENTLHFIVRFNADGRMDKFEVVDEPGRETFIKEVVIVGSYNPDLPIKFTDSSKKYTPLFTSSLKTVLHKIKIPKGQYIPSKDNYFKVSFRIEKIYDSLVEPY